MFEEAKDFEATVQEFIQIFEGLVPHKTLYKELMPRYEAGFRRGYEKLKQDMHHKYGTDSKNFTPDVPYSSFR